MDLETFSTARSQKVTYAIGCEDEEEMVRMTNDVGLMTIYSFEIYAA